MAKILVIDLGTTYFKFSLFDHNGQLCQLARWEPPIRRPQADRMELEAASFADVLKRGIAQLGRQAGGLADVEAVSFATQTNSFLLLDADDAPLTPIILWPDQRAAELEAEFRQHSTIPGFRATTGIPGINAQFMIAKLVWLRRHMPRAWQRMRRLCLISDYLSLLLTGQYVTEAGAAGLTGLLDIQHCRWWPELMARLELDERWLPAAVRAGTDLGPLRPAAADQFGLPRTCRFVVGCLDQYAAAISADNVAPGSTSESTGTVLATISAADHLCADLHAAVFQGPAFAERRFYRMAFGEVSAGYLEWYRNLLPDRPDFDALTALAEDVEPGAEGLRLNPDVPRTTPEEVFCGWTSRHTRAHAVRCILEAVAWELRKQILWLCENALPAAVRSAGGGARSDLWLKIKADVLGVPVAATQCPEPASLGAAILAEASLSGSSVPQVARQWVRLRNPHTPDPRRHRRYQTLMADVPGQPADLPTNRALRGSSIASNGVVEP